MQITGFVLNTHHSELLALVTVNYNVITDLLGDFIYLQNEVQIWSILD